MPAVWSATLVLITVVVILALIYRSLGDYLAHVFTSAKNWRLERGLYRLIGVDPAVEQSSPVYLRSVLAFSAIGILLVYALQRLQPLLPWSNALPGVEPGLAFNTAISFVTNTNWQSYSPEQTMGFAVQIAALTVQNFLSAAVGIAVAVALIRGFAAVRTGTVGNFWVDVTRSITRILLPLSIVTAILLVAAGVIQNFTGWTDVATITGGTQSIPGGPVASEEAIKMLGNNGGGFFNANSAHPFENPSGLTNLFQLVLMFAIPVALTRTLGVMVGDRRQGYAILGVMSVLAIASITLLVLAETSGAGSAAHAAGGAMEGKETRYGPVLSAMFAAFSTLTSTGAVNSMHDSFTAGGGAVTMVNMMLGEVAPGGAGSGMYGMLVLAIIAVFVAGLMVGRTPEYLGKRIGRREMTFASLYILTTPAIVLAGTALSFAIPGVRSDVIDTSMAKDGIHGYSEVLYAFTSAGNNNGSAFAGLTANTPWFNTALGVAMMLGRFLPMVFVLALAGSLASQDKVPVTPGTLPTHTPQFVGLLIGVVLIVSALTYLPVLALGPIAEGLN
ncbi:potassium-transporting ATPase subunit KdpA [soil metagenome]